MLRAILTTILLSLICSACCTPTPLDGKLPIPKRTLRPRLSPVAFVIFRNPVDGSAGPSYTPVVGDERGTHVVMPVEEAETLSRYVRRLEAERDAFYEHPFFEEQE